MTTTPEGGKTRKTYYTAQGEIRALRPYLYQTEDGQRWSFSGRTMAQADSHAVRWAKKRGIKIYKVKRRKLEGRKP